MKTPIAIGRLGRFARFAACGTALMVSVATPAAPNKNVQRGETVAIEVAFMGSLAVRSAYMTWQNYDPVGKTQSGMISTFGCPSTSNGAEKTIVLACKIPINVADGHYYLTSISIEAGDFRRTYSFQKDFPRDIELDVKGGNRFPLPDISSMHLK